MLNQYSVDVRYNYDFAREMTYEDAKEAIEIAEKVKEFVMKKLEYEGD